MKQIRVFTEEYQSILEQRLSTAAPHSFDELVAGLSDVAEQIMGAVSEKVVLETKFRDFLSENDYIHLDAFIRICLEEKIHA